MSGIILKKTLAASIPTPATDKLTIFHDDATDAPAYKDDTGTTNPIGSGGAPSGSAGGVLGGTYPNPSFAADMATQAELDAHTADTTDAHDASAVSIVDAGGYFTGTQVEAALQELGAGTGPVVQLADGSATSNDAAALTAGAALVAAIAALPTAFPNPGGVIQLGRGFYTLAASGAGSQLDFTALSFIQIRGIGAVSGGGASGTVIETYSTGSGNIVILDSSTAITFKDLMIRYQSTSFTGKLVATAGTTANCSHLKMENVILQGSSAVGQTAILLYLNQSITGVFDRVNFYGGGYQVYGKRNVAISGVSVANPTTITATAHGYTTGQSVTIGGTSVTPNLNTNDGWVITVTGANTFTIPANVTVVTTGTGGVSSSVDYSNVMTFRDCLWINARIMAVWNPGYSWDFINITAQATATGAGYWMDHSPGNGARGVSILGGWMGDNITTGQTEQWIKFAGSAFTCKGVMFGGSSANTNTAVRFDGYGVDGWEFVGNIMTGMYRDIDFTTVAATNGFYASNAHNNVIAGWASFTGTAPKGEYKGDPNTTTRPAQFSSVLTGSATATWWDSDTTAKFYRLSTGLLLAVGELDASLDIRAGLTQTAVTRVYGAASGTVAGIEAEGSNSNVDIALVPKGTGRIRLTVRGAAGVPSGAPTGTELPIAYDTTGVTGGTYAWNGAAWVKISTI